MWEIAGMLAEEHSEGNGTLILLNGTIGGDADFLWDECGGTSRRTRWTPENIKDNIEGNEGQDASQEEFDGDSESGSSSQLAEEANLTSTPDARYVCIN